jgi:hypothetical protein
MLMPYVDLSKGPLRPDVARAIQALRDRIEELETLLGADAEECERFAALRIPFICRKLLGLLLARRVLAREAAHAIIYGGLPECDHPATKSLDVHIHRIRRQLRGHGIEVRCEWGIGWSISPADKAKIYALIGEAAP